ncbi:hypothetical protein [Pseudoduganella sp. UC29_71]|uniref:phosphorylase family protein n=1 Tax=Pseudoduganella sp. UC29_71 TaxID=3350174 RepID=UPI0036719FC9
MNILIVDDNPKRYSRLLGKLTEIGIDRSNVSIVGCANDARDKLESEQFDLMILDILLPLWPEDEPSTRSSLELLMEIHSQENLNRPKRVLGITADLQLNSAAAESFRQHTWTVVEYSADSDEWINRAINCVSYSLNDGKNERTARPEYSVDLAVICALERPELEEVLKLNWNWSSPRPLDDVTFVRDGYFYVGSKKITVCATFAPRMGMVSTALRSASIISMLRPRLIAMCGICAGVRGKVNMGDVLLADPAWDFQSGKRVKDKINTSFSISPHQLPAPAIIRSHVEQLRSQRQELINLSTAYGSDAPSVPQIFIGPVASGSAVLADGEVINDIKQQHRDLVGVEMEIYGMYAAAQTSSQPQPLAFALKSVCDFADPDKGDDNQRFAAYTSANVLRLLMEKYGPRLLV